MQKLLAKFEVKFSLLSNDELLFKFQSVSPNVKELRQFKKQSKTPIYLRAEIWRVTNNIDALRDIYIDGENFCVDATSKDELEGYTRDWPMQTELRA